MKGRELDSSGNVENHTTDQVARPVDQVAARVSDALLEIEHLEVEFRLRGSHIPGRPRATVHAVSDVTFSLSKGETLGIVGESGCGKSTLLRTLMCLTDATRGSIQFRGREITRASSRKLRSVRREMQMVFQDPYSSLNPRKRVIQILSPLLRMRGVSRKEVEAHSRNLLWRVGLRPEHINRYPHEFSGGQRQRIGIARALAVKPTVILLDEPVSALDVSLQAQVINLLEDLQDELHLSYIFVAHDLSVVRHVSDRIAVMYLGKIVEAAPVDELHERPIHPYTIALLNSIPPPDPRTNRTRARDIPVGEPPNPVSPPTGCRFHTRCPFADETCRLVEPPLMEFSVGHIAACHHPQNVTHEAIARAVRSTATPLAAGSFDFHDSR